MSRIHEANSDRVVLEKSSSQVLRTRIDARLSYRGICSRRTVVPGLDWAVAMKERERELINLRIGDLISCSSSASGRLFAG